MFLICIGLCKINYLDEVGNYSGKDGFNINMLFFSILTMQKKKKSVFSV